MNQTSFLPRSIWTLALALTLTYCCSICGTCVAQAPIADDKTIQIPFRLTRWNNISVPSIVGNNFAVNLMFHTATNDLSLTRDTLRMLPEINLDQHANINTWGGKSTSQFGENNSLHIGPLKLDSARIFSCQHSGHQTGGKFGLAQLSSKIFEIDFDACRIVLHDSVPTKAKSWKHHPIRIEHGLIFVTAELSDKLTNTNQEFLLHSGYSGFMLLDDEFVQSHDFIDQLEIIEEAELTDSSGKKTKTRKSMLPAFSIGKTTFEQTPVSFFPGTIGSQNFSLLGGDFLKRFNMVFDLNNNHLYLDESKHFKANFFTKPKPAAPEN
jgi:hypothetical protein